MPKKLIVVHPEGHEKAGQPTGVIQFTGDDGTSHTLDINSLNSDMVFRLAVHGASQKVGDSYAGAKAEENPVAFANQAIAETIKQLQDNLWRVGGGGGGGPRITDLANAYARAAGVSVEAAVEFLGGLTEEETKVLRKKPKVAAQLAAIAAEKAQARAARLAEEAAKADAA
jgi:hypothetical protein